MGETLQITVVLITFNHEKFITEAIRSVLGQTFQDFELVVVDNGSTDRTSELIQTIVQTSGDKRIRSFRQENGGPSVGLNRGIAEARGKYIAIFSGDDICEPNRLQVQLDAAQNLGKRAIFSHAKVIGETGQPTDTPVWLQTSWNVPNGTQAQYLNRFFNKGNFLCAVSAFIEKSLLPTPKNNPLSGPFNPLLLQLQDFDLWKKILQETDLWMIEQSLVKYRIRDNDANLSSPKKKVFNCGSTEHFLILKNFFAGISDDLFRSAFQNQLRKPNFQGPVQRKIEEAFLFLSTEEPYKKLCGVELVSELYNDPKAVECLKSEYGFKNLDFSNYLGVHPIFSKELAGVTNVYVNTGSGYKETDRVWQNIVCENGPFELAFDLSRLQGQVQEIRWDPIEGQFCELELDSISLTTSSGRTIHYGLEQITSNGLRFPENRWLFLNTDPIMILNRVTHFNRREPSESVVKLSVKGKWRFLSHREIEDLYRDKPRRNWKSTWKPTWKSWKPTWSQKD